METGLCLNPGLLNELGLRSEKERKIKDKLYYLGSERLSSSGENQFEGEKSRVRF